ncbi:hypothetical protein X878_0069 [Enterococcus phage VD13]|uniref:Uncharacterized protein n=1 Tax=Enterococcus phage VD13 TaxID=1458851 RepID=X2KXS5_9CAUD|nr:hypothetical protein X878_0069 [Enterococcus phage VD13]YP_009592511.1 hypothetical protein FDG77_gp70 [Enterococcus phage VD13]AHL19655.1 hypothetical protein VD13_070 [Enterococcus phage VD13]AHN83157.1 hypothetical protein X878_0069 [Enterococcus phage VD13]
MLTKDFIKEVEKIGLEADNRFTDMLYIESHDGVVVSINKDCSKTFTWCEGTGILVGSLFKLIPLVEEYANTPIEEREKKVSEKPLESYSINELGEAISKILLNKLNPYAQVVISQEQIQIYEPKWCTPSEWANKNL